MKIAENSFLTEMLENKIKKKKKNNSTIRIAFQHSN